MRPRLPLDDNPTAHDSEMKVHPTTCRRTDGGPGRLARVRVDVERAALDVVLATTECRPAHVDPDGVQRAAGLTGGCSPRKGEGPVTEVWGRLNAAATTADDPLRTTRKSWV